MLETIIASSVILPFALATQLGISERDWSRIMVHLIFAVTAFLLTYRLVPIIKRFTANADLAGYDMNKREKKLIPESLGIVPAVIYIVVTILSSLYYHHDREMLLEYNSSLLWVAFMTLLGFADDVLDLPWRYKLILPLVASLPIVVVYSGPTGVVVPVLFREWFGHMLELGVFYRVYMALLAIFCTNSINIYAGINGIEVGQTIIITLAVITHNLIEIGLHTSETIYRQHMLSLGLMLPLAFALLGLFKYNKYPSQVFVGDTFCYFAGMALATAGILGHFSKTLLGFFAPQILNFLLSVPQIFGIIPCPRHRMPEFDRNSGKL